MLRDQAPNARPDALKTARRQRRDMSPAEVAVWVALRERPGGLKFRRQHPTGVYSLDFYCSDARLAIEVDGEAHSRGDRPARDAARDAWLMRHGIATLRVPAIDVFRNIEGVIDGIVATARERLPLHHPAALGGPPPRDKLGEDLQESP